MTDVFEDEVEQTVSIQEYLNDVEERELEADLVLGGDDGKECTYRNGYMKRQAVFSCLTCTPDGNAGVCIACSLSCHDGHEVVELWTKRNFRCDCGNSKFGEFFCKLFPNKDVENPYNLYNHNFKGLYCTCNRPHPDPNVEEQQEMMQCCICEDWFHEEHLGLQSPDDVPKDEDGEPIYEDFICEGCSSICSFLTLYPARIWTSATPDEDGASNLKGKNSLEEPHIEAGVSVGEMTNCDGGSSDCISNSKADRACIIDVDLPKGPPVVERGKPMFLSRCWRDQLCRCEKCSTFYEQKCINFLLNKEDTIAEYEKTAKEKREEKLQQQEGAELNFINKLGHAEKMEILSGITDMKNEINHFLESFDSSKTITTDDVHRVFENLAKKRRRIE